MSAAARAAFEDRGLSFEQDAAFQLADALAKETGCKMGNLVRQYEAWAANSDADTTVVSAALMEDFATHARGLLAAQSSKTPQAGKRRSHAPSDITNSHTVTPAAAPVVAAATPTGARQGEPHDQEPANKVRKVVVESVTTAQTFNGHLRYSRKEADAEPCRVQVLGLPWGAEHRHMVDRLEDKVKYVAGRIEGLAPRLEAEDALAAVHSQTQVPGLLQIMLQLRDVRPALTVAGQDMVTYCGRICCDSEGALNTSSILLEGGLADSQGQCVRVDISRLEAFRTFPGQVVALRGSNATGQQIEASAACRPQPLPQNDPITGAALGSQPMAVLIAAGPFTGSAELSYEALDGLLQQCIQADAQAVILIGPFVDTEHLQVRTGSLDATFEQVFDTQVVERLRSWLQGAGQDRQVLLVPSTRDAPHLACLPQPAFCSEALAGIEGLHCLPNPATFSLGGVTFGTVSTDVIKHLSSAEYKQGDARAERLACLMAHLMAQRSYYPLYPAAPGVMLDTSHAAHLRMPCTPDVLLLPSDLAPGARNTPASADVLPPTSAAVDPAARNVLCINPGRTVKGTAGGTCALLQLCRAEEAGARVSQRSRVETLKLS